MNHNSTPAKGSRRSLLHLYLFLITARVTVFVCVQGGGGQGLAGHVGCSGGRRDCGVLEEKEEEGLRRRCMEESNTVGGGEGEKGPGDSSFDYDYYQHVDDLYQKLVFDSSLAKPFLSSASSVASLGDDSAKDEKSLPLAGLFIALHMSPLYVFTLIGMVACFFVYFLSDAVFKSQCIAGQIRLLPDDDYAEEERRIQEVYGKYLRKAGANGWEEESVGGGKSKEAAVVKESVSALGGGCKETGKRGEESLTLRKVYGALSAKDKCKWNSGIVRSMVGFGFFVVGLMCFVTEWHSVYEHTETARGRSFGNHNPHPHPHLRGDKTGLMSHGVHEEESVPYLMRGLDPGSFHCYMRGDAWSDSGNGSGKRSNGDVCMSDGYGYFLNGRFVMYETPQMTDMRSEYSSSSSAGDSSSSSSPSFIPLSIWFGKHSIAEISKFVFFGFGFFEVLVMLELFFIHGEMEKALMLHHVMLIVGSWVFCYYDIGDFYHCVLVPQEISAPFTAFSWMLTKLRMKDSGFWLLNQCALLSVWVVVRFFMDAITMYMLYTDWAAAHVLLPSFPKYFILFSQLFLICVLNPLWFMKKTEQLLKSNAYAKWMSKPPVARYLRLNKRKAS
eukprot:Nk52_evm4s331 gene=Nk52_evmTU4s331